MGYTDTQPDDVVMSTNWDYLKSMKMNELAPAANLGPVTHPEKIVGGEHFVPWFWPDGDMARAVKIRQAAFLDNPKRVLATADNDPVVRAASQQLLHLQARYLSEHFPEKYAIENQRKFGKVIINKVTEDQFSLRPEKNDWHPLAISGMLSQEDICMVQRKKSGRHVLVAGFLATPTNWNLSNFMNADMDKIHKHVKGYHKPVNKESKYQLKDTVDKVLDNLREYPDGLMGRNNLFVEYIPTLAREPRDGRTFEMKDILKDPGNAIFLRSERETLTRLPEPYEDFSIFTIKPNVFRMADVVRLRGADFARVVATNSVIRSSLKSDKGASAKSQFDFTELLENYLAANEAAV